MINKVSNIDTICILIYIENYEISASNLLTRLQKEKQLLLEACRETNNFRYIINISGMEFELLPNGCKGYAFILKNEGFELKISLYQSKIENFAPLQVRISSEYLWSYGIEKSWQIISNWITSNIGKIALNKISRIDLCTHVSGYDFIENYENSYKGQFKKFDNTYHTGKTINSITFGTRKGKNIYCRIYNKTLEVKELKKKYWFFEIWKQNGLDIQNVWNLEFELKGEFLRSINVITFEDCLNNIIPIWQYCTSKWLIKVDRIKKRIDRCPTNEGWIEIQGAFGNIDNKLFIDRKKQVSLDANILVPNIIGCITSYSARIQKTNIKKVFEDIRVKTTQYLSDKNTTFEEEVVKKSKLLY